jgi:hypothetical protein
MISLGAISSGHIRFCPIRSIHFVLSTAGYQALQAAAQLVQVDPNLMEVRGPATDLERAFAALAHERVEAHLGPGSRGSGCERGFVAQVGRKPISPRGYPF